MDGAARHPLLIHFTECQLIEYLTLHTRIDQVITRWESQRFSSFTQQGKVFRLL
jgi:hypothetical protein